MASVEKGSQFVTALQAESPTSVEAVVNLVLATLEARREHAKESPALMHRGRVRSIRAADRYFFGAY